MGLPRGQLLWLLLLLAAACSGILFSLYSSAVARYPGPRSGARNATSSRAFVGHKASNAGTRKSLHCQHPLYLAIQKHPHFRALFNLSTPVLLSGALFTQELWDRLSQHKAPYGWQGLSRQDISSTLSLLNGSESSKLLAASRKPLSKCVRCAVVGNGGILNGSRQGLHIDAHDYVFRLNGAVIKGFEKDVGTKTSFYGFTVNTMKNSLISYGNFGFTSVPKGQDLRYIFIPSDIRDYVMLRSAILGVPVPEGPRSPTCHTTAQVALSTSFMGPRPQTYFGPEASARKFKLLHPDFISYTHKSPLWAQGSRLTAATCFCRILFHSQKPRLRLYSFQGSIRYFQASACRSGALCLRRCQRKATAKGPRLLVPFGPARSRHASQPRGLHRKEGGVAPAHTCSQQSRESSRDVEKGLMGNVVQTTAAGNGRILSAALELG